MKKLNLKSMSASELIDLRASVDAVLAAKVKGERTALEAQLQSLSRFGNVAPGTDRKAHALAGRKVAPKYQGPDGETWTGRGLKPKWLAAALKGGRKIEEFLIAAGASGRRGKRGRSAKA
jgi:DNA-binding protein H-NS